VGKQCIMSEVRDVYPTSRYTCPICSFFAFFGDFECYGDLSPIDPCFAVSELPTALKLMTLRITDGSVALFRRFEVIYPNITENPHPSRKCLDWWHRGQTFASHPERCPSTRQSRSRKSENLPNRTGVRDDYSRF